MRQEPFSLRDVPLIVQAVARDGKWKGTRDGRRVRFERYHSLHEPGIAWFVTVKPRQTLCGIAPTVRDAMEEAAVRLKTSPAPARKERAA
jgi:hypothetical protein